MVVCLLRMLQVLLLSLLRIMACNNLLRDFKTVIIVIICLFGYGGKFQGPASEV